MPPFSYDKIPFGVKASNISAVVNFSSTLDDSYALFIANNCNTPVYNNPNSYDTVYNSFNNAAMFGANLINQTDHEAYVAIKSNDTVKKIAQFNKTNATINANILPFTNSAYDIGTPTSKWQNIHANNLYGDGSHLTNVNISDRTTNNLSEGPNNLYYTDQRFDDRLATKTLDALQDGTKNRFIINNNYKGDFNVEGTLSACNLVIEGDTTVLNTTLYQSERMEIANDASGPALKITQNAITGDALQVYNNASLSLSVNNEGNLIANGTASAAAFIGDGSNITNINLVDKLTLHLKEDPNGSNLYFTPQRAGLIAEASNIHTSNYISSVNNAFNNNFDNRLATKTLDNIANGSTNKYITNNTYTGSLNVTQTLTAFDLVATNSFVFNKVVQQTVVQASRTEIYNESIGPALKVTQNDGKISKVLEVYSVTDIALSIINSGYVGINKLSPAYNLDVCGTANATFFRGNGSLITNINLVDKSTRYLAEDPGGSNLYFTPQRAAAVIDMSNIDTCNFTKSTSNQIISYLHITDANASNYTKHISDDTSNFVKTTSNILLEQLKNITTKDVAEDTNLYYTDERFDIRLLSKTLDTIHPGTSNRFIINNNFKGNLNIEGTLSACNLVIEGDTTVLNTTLYSTEQFQINNQSSEPAFKITQHSTGPNIHDIVQVYYNTDTILNINTAGFIGIHKPEPKYTLDIEGILNATKIIGDGVYMSNINLSDKTTAYLKEDPGGSNLYFTSHRVGVIADASNIHTSNYVDFTSNTILNIIAEIDTNQSNYVATTSNTLLNVIITSDTNASNYVTSTSNMISSMMIQLDNHQSNYNIVSSNDLISIMSLKDTNQSNYIITSSNAIINIIELLNENQSNYVLLSSNAIINRIITTDANQSNYTTITSNVLTNTLALSDVNQSNYVLKSSNLITHMMLELSSNQSNYVLRSSNTLAIMLMTLNTNQSNYVIMSSNNLANMITILDRNQSNYVRNTCNIISREVNRTYTEAIAYTQTTTDTLNTALNRGLNSVSTFVNSTSNLLAANTNFLNGMMSNYVRDTSNDLVRTQTRNDILTSNYISATSNVITRQLLNNEADTCNYIVSVRNISAANISDTSNYVLSTNASLISLISTNDVNTCNYIKETDRTIHKRISDLDTNQIKEAINLYYTDERFDVRLLSKTLDAIHQGTSNQFIANGNYKGNLNIQGTLSACNLVIEGDTTVLNTTTYQTESLEILNAGTSPTLKLTQSGFYSILEAYDDTSLVFKMTDTGNIGIKVAEPAYEIDVAGTIQAFQFKGKGNSLSDINLSDKSTRYLKEDPGGSNLYFTTERVGVIAQASNVHSSNYINVQSNLITAHLLSNEKKTCNYVELTSNLIVQQFSKSALDNTGYVNLTCNNILSEIKPLVLSNDANSSNYVLSASNNIINYILHLSNDTCNFVRQTCNFVFDTTSANLYKTSNNIQNYISYTSNDIQRYIAYTSNIIVRQFIYFDSNTSNFVSLTSNNLLVQTSNLHISQSNYVSSTSNNIIKYMLQLNSNQSNYTLSVSNILATSISNIDVRQSNYLQTTYSNLNRDLLNVIAYSNLNLSNYVAATLSNLIITDIRQSNYTFNVSNILVNRLVNLEAAQSNYIINTSNRLATTAFTYNINQSNNVASAYIQLRDFIVLRNTEQSNYVFSTDDRLDKKINLTNVNQSNYVLSTNNSLINLISTNNRNQSNYVASTSTQIYAKIKLLDDYDAYLFNRTDYLTKTLSTTNNTVFNNNVNQSNYTKSIFDILNKSISSTSNKLTDYMVNYISVELRNTSNQISNRLSDTSNYMVNYIAVELRNTSNQISNRLSDTSNYMINYVGVELRNTSNQISNRLSDTSNYMVNYIGVKLIETSNELINRLNMTTITTDDMTQGIHNKFIVDNVYNSNLRVNGTLVACNLIIEGDTSMLNTVTYQTERLEIVSSALGPALKVQQYGDQDIMALYDDNNLVFRVFDGGNISFAGNLNNITTNELDYIRGVNAPIQQQINRLTNQMIDVSDALYNNIQNTSNNLRDLIFHTSNKVYTDLHNNLKFDTDGFSNYIANMTTDDIEEGVKNRYIVDDKYERDIVFTETATATTLVTKSLIDFGGIDIYNDVYYTPSLMIKHMNDADVLNISVGNVPKIFMRNNGFVGFHTDFPEYDVDVAGTLNATRFSGDGGLLQNVNLSDKSSDDIIEGNCNLYFREERLNEMIMSKSIDMFQPGSNMSIIRNGVYYGSLLVAGHLTVNSLKIIDVNAAYISSNASNFGDGVFGNDSDFYGGSKASLALISNLDYDIKYVSNMLLQYKSITSLDQVGNGTSNKYIINNWYDGPLNVNGKMQANYVGGDGMFLTNVNLLDKTTDHLAEGFNRLYYTHDRFVDSMQNVNADYLNNGTCNQFIVNGVYEGDLIVTGELTVSRVQILDIFANVLNSNYEASYYQSSNSYVQSLASFIRNINQNLVNEMKIYDRKLNLIMTCNMDETILGMIVNDSNLLLRRFGETIDYVNQNVSNLNDEIYESMSNLIQYVNENVSRVDYYYTIDETSKRLLADIVNSSNKSIYEKINSLNTNDIKEGNNLYFTHKRAGAICYASNLHASNYVDYHIYELNRKLDDSNITSINSIKYNVDMLENIIEYCNINASNYIELNAERLDNRINYLTLDEISMGCNNSYIRNNVYDGYLIVTGGIITNNVVISDLDEAYLMLSSNVKDLLTSTPFKSSSNSYLQYLINKVNIHSDIIEDNYDNLTRLSSNFDLIMDLLKNIDTTAFGVNSNLFDDINSNVGICFDRINELDAKNSNTLYILNSNVGICIDRINGLDAKSSNTLYILNSNVGVCIDRINELDAKNSNTYNVLNSNVGVCIDRINGLDAKNSNTLYILNSNVGVCIDRIAVLEGGFRQQNIISNIRLDLHESNIFHTSNEIEKLKYDLVLANNKINQLENVNTAQTYQINTLNSSMQYVLNKLAIIEGLSLVTQQINVANTEIITSNISETVDTVQEIANSLTSLIEIPNIPNAGIVLLDNPTNDLGVLQANIETILEKVTTYEAEVYSIFDFPPIEIDIPDISLPVNYYTANDEENARLYSITSNAQIIQNKINIMKAYFDALFVFSDTI